MTIIIIIYCHYRHCHVISMFVCLFLLWRLLTVCAVCTGRRRQYMLGDKLCRNRPYHHRLQPSVPVFPCVLNVLKSPVLRRWWTAGPVRLVAECWALWPSQRHQGAGVAPDPTMHGGGGWGWGERVRACTLWHPHWPSAGQGRGQH